MIRILQITKDRDEIIDGIKSRNIEQRCKWRAKADTDNKWLYGSLNNVYGNTDFSIIVSDTNRTLNILVKADTVSQYAELTDKNGKDVYEGDILRITDKSNTVDFIGVIIYTQMSWKIAVNDIDNQQGLFSQFEVNPCLDEKFDIEVIGNVWDNSDLLNDTIGFRYY